MVEACRIVPEGRVPNLSHHVNLRVRHACLVLLDGSGFDNGIINSVSNQHRFANLLQEIIVVESAREKRFPDKGGDRQIVS
jgi:hypothetical protein